MSDIQAYFEDKTVFLTGATGFLGKLIIEKLLRTCSTIKKIYVLVREKKGVKPEDRLKQIFDSKAFDLLKAQQTNFMEKVVILTGDLEQRYLGLSQADIKKLQNDVQIVLHCGATVRFDQTLKKVAAINIQSTKDLIEICRSAKNLESFVYVSTAYSNCNLKHVEERIYDPYLKADTFLKMTEDLDDDTLDKITPVLIKDLPNTYVLSKATTESMILKEGVGLPISIVRPSIVLSSLTEPIPGWTDNFYAATGGLVAVGLGFLHSMQIDITKKADLIPVDMVVNNIIAVAFDTNRRLFSLIPGVHLNSCSSSLWILLAFLTYIELKDNELKVFTCATGKRCSFTWGDYFEITSSQRFILPLSRAIWYPFVFLPSSMLAHTINMFLLHKILALIVDFVLILLLKDPFMVPLVNKLDKFTNAISYFATQEWIFEDTNTRKLYEGLKEKDKELFPFDVESINWVDYVKANVVGARIYLLNDPLETIPAARRKAKMLFFVHCATVTFLLYLMFKFLSFLFYCVF